MTALFEGLVLGFGLIISMGPQNVFIIRQGFKREYPYVSALICAACDTLLVLMSILGMSELIYLYPKVKNMIIFFGFIFLVEYGIRSIYIGIRGLINPRYLDLKNTLAPISLASILLTGISFSLFNPHAIADSLILVGTAIQEYSEEEKLIFIAGVISASYLWYYGIAALSISCSEYLINYKVWAILDIISGLIMLSFSIILLCL